MKVILHANALAVCYRSPHVGPIFGTGDLPNLPDYETHRDSSYDHTGANHDYVSVQPGQTVTIFDEDGPGEIRHIWTTIPPWSEAYAHQKVVIRAYWDGETDPSVESPLGNFFGIAFGTGTFPVFQSALISVLPAQALNSYFPMPFRKHGRITITNEGHKEISDYYWNIDWVKLPEILAKSWLFSRAIPPMHPLQRLVLRRHLRQRFRRSAQGSPLAQPQWRR